MDSQRESKEPRNDYMGKDFCYLKCSFSFIIYFYTEYGGIRKAFGKLLQLHLLRNKSEIS